MPSESVLITGASAGIGEALARLFAEDKSNLILVARREEKLSSLAKNLHDKFGINVNIIVSDLSKPDSPRQIYEKLRE